MAKMKAKLPSGLPSVSLPQEVSTVAANLPPGVSGGMQEWGQMKEPEPVRTPGVAEATPIQPPWDISAPLNAPNSPEMMAGNPNLSIHPAAAEALKMEMARPSPTRAPGGGPNLTSATVQQARLDLSSEAVFAGNDGELGAEAIERIERELGNPKNRLTFLQSAFATANIRWMGLEGGLREEISSRQAAKLDSLAVSGWPQIIRTWARGMNWKKIAALILTICTYEAIGEILSNPGTEDMPAE